MRTYLDENHEFKYVMKDNVPCKIWWYVLCITHYIYIGLCKPLWLVCSVCKNAAYALHIITMMIVKIMYLYCSLRINYIIIYSAMRLCVVARRITVRTRNCWPGAKVIYSGGASRR